MAKKYYAIKKGYDIDKKNEIQDVIVESWDQCLKHVKGVKGAIYKSFQTLEEAETYLKQENRILKKNKDQYPTDVPQAYVDGSYNLHTGKYGYGVVIVENDIITYLESDCAKDDSEKGLRQIAGELKAALRAIEYAVLNKFEHIVILHDYEGISHHATGAWERRDKSSQEYYEKVNKLKDENNLKITFVKVDSHTNDLYNEIADEEAKIAIGLEINRVVEKLVALKEIKVLNDEVAGKLKQLISDPFHESIIVINNNEKNHIEEKKEDIFSFQNEEELIEYIRNLDEEEKNNLIIEIWKKLKINY